MIGENPQLEACSKNGPTEAGVHNPVQFGITIFHGHKGSPAIASGCLQSAIPLPAGERKLETHRTVFKSMHKVIRRAGVRFNGR